MKKKAKFFRNKGDNSLKFTVSVTTSFTIPARTGSTDYDIDWGDGNTTIGQSGDATHSYSGSGSYQISITGTFTGFYFNNTGDKTLITSIDQWGAVPYSINQTAMLQGCTNLTSIASDVDWINSVTVGYAMFNNCTSLTSLPSGLTFESLTDASYMFGSSNLTSLPEGITLENVTTGIYMFQNGDLTSLPSTLDLSSLTNGLNMFYNNNFTSLPSGIGLGSLTNGNNMFQGCPLTALPSGLVLGSLTSGNNMFFTCPITSVPSSMTLASLTTGVNMFYHASAKINTTDYSQLINNIDTYNSNTGVTFRGGLANYDSSAQTAHDNLTGTKSWTITDGGLV